MISGCHGHQKEDFSVTHRFKATSGDAEIHYNAKGGELYLFDAQHPKGRLISIVKGQLRDERPLMTTSIPQNKVGPVKATCFENCTTLKIKWSAYFQREEGQPTEYKQIPSL